MFKFLITLLLFFGISVLAEEEPYYIGIEGGYGFVNYDAGFNQFEGIDKCGIYEKGGGSAIFGRLWGEYLISDDISIGAHIQYTMKDGILDKLDTAFARDLNTGNIGIIGTNNELDVNFNSISVGLDFNLLIQRDLFNGPLYFNVSPSLIVNHSGRFIQKEYIQSPDGAAFEGPDGYFFERTNAEGNLNTLTNMIPILSASLYNSSKISDNLYFTQKIGVSNDMSSLLDDANISSLTLFASLGIKLSFEKEEIVIEPPKKPIQPQPIIPVPEPYISLNLEINNESTYIIKQDEIYAQSPLVLALFFDKNSSEIRNHYLNESVSNNNPIQSHNNIIYDISDILINNPESKITLVSSTSGADENNDINLALNRAQSVNDKLYSIGIDSNRINISSQKLPKVPTNNEYETGLEENRRVEFKFSNLKLDRVGLRTKKKELYSEISVSTDTENLSNRAKLSNSFNDSKYSVYDTSLSFKYYKDLLINESTNIIEINSSLIANSLSENDSKTIDLSKIETRNLETEFSNFELYLLFDFSSSELSDNSKKDISDLIDLLPEGRTIEIIGNTDKIGMEKANIEIAQNRANSARKYIESITTKQYYFDIKTNTSKFDESTPQGRFLNRSIRIRIR
jgi:outer membrane protein OmpA-like peptidoglycan-associated protein